MLGNFIIFDLETTGLPIKRNAPINDLNNWPRIVQFAFGIYKSNGECIEEYDYVIKPDNFTIPENSTKIHKITNEYAIDHGYEIKYVLEYFLEKLKNIDYLVAHNLKFDKKILETELYRNNFDFNLQKYNLKDICTMETSTNFCKLEPFRYNTYKWPRLEELHKKLFDEKVDGFHNALVDIQVCKKCLFKLIELNIIELS